jgi:hypothetical protein
MRARALWIAVLLAVPTAAGAFARTEACAGTHLWWRGAPPIVKLEVNVGSVGNAADGCTSATGVLDAVRASAVAWTPSCTGFAFDVATIATTSKDVGYVKGGTNQNLVVFRTGRCSDPQVVPPGDPCVSGAGGQTCADVYDCWDDTLYGTTAIAVTTVSYDTRTGEILDADVELRGWNGQSTGTTLSSGSASLGEYFTCAAAAMVCTTYGEAACRARDVQNVLTHETGHALGLAHSTGVGSQTATMYAMTYMGELTKRDLDPDDVAGVCAIYPGSAAAAPDGTCAVSSPPSSGGGCSHAGSGPAAGALVALLAAAARRARAGRRA